MTVSRSLEVRARGKRLPATLTLPVEGGVVGGIVPLHGASGGDRNTFWYAHLAETLAPHGWATLRYDRRGDHVTLPKQADDALAAMSCLRDQLDSDVPIGLWGLSQGAWTAVEAASKSQQVAFCVLVGFSGVTPAAQMRFFTTNALRDAGYADAIEEAAPVRDAFVRWRRGELNKKAAQAIIDSAGEQPWFELVKVPDRLPPRVFMRHVLDFDHDPVPGLAKTSCPILALYGENEKFVPIDESVAAIARSGADVTVIRYPGVGHGLKDGEMGVDGNLTPDYERDLVDWLTSRVTQKT